MKHSHVFPGCGWFFLLTLALHASAAEASAPAWIDIPQTQLSQQTLSATGTATETGSTTQLEAALSSWIPASFSTAS